MEQYSKEPHDCRDESEYGAQETASSSRAPAASAAVRILEAIANAEQDIGISAISAETGLNKSMVVRVISVLVQSGWVAEDKKSGKYRLTMRLFCLGSRALSRVSLMKAASAHLLRLNEATGECIQFAIPSGSGALYIAQYEAKGYARISGELGRVYPETTSSGMLFKAYFSEEESEIRKKGYAMDDESYGKGIVCISAPVFDYTGKLVAGVCLASLTVKYTAAELERQFAAAVCATAERISHELGYYGEE